MVLFLRHGQTQPNMIGHHFHRPTLFLLCWSVGIGYHLLSA